jgi:hypothetical protein
LMMFRRVRATLQALRQRNHGRTCRVMNEITDSVTRA